MRKIICFDLEGPLSPTDHAYEAMKLIPGGERVFEVISRYDDLLTIEGRKNYEPGDTLKLIVPFLIQGKVTEVSLKKISGKAALVNGAKKLIAGLRQSGWQIFIISTSYEQHAFNVAQKLGVSRANVFCTRFPLDYHQKGMDEKSLLMVDSARNFIASRLWKKNLGSGKEDREIKDFLDKFFWPSQILRGKIWAGWDEAIKNTELKKAFEAVKVMGGSRKVEALEIIANRISVSLAEIVTVGDSITDFKMLEATNKAGGLAVVFNGNEYALPYGTVGLAATDIMDIKKILDVWTKGRREAVKAAIEAMGLQKNFHWLLDKTKEEMAEIIEIHKGFRKKVRGKAAANLG